MKIEVGDVVKPVGSSHYCLVLEPVVEDGQQWLCRHVGSDYEGIYWLGGPCRRIDAITQAILKANGVFK